MPGQKLDEIDRMILAELQADGRMTNVELAKRVGKADQHDLLAGVLAGGQVRREALRITLRLGIQRRRARREPEGGRQANARLDLVAFKCF